MNKPCNNVLLSGYIDKNVDFVHNFNGTSIFRTYLVVKRLSSKEDILPIYLSSKLENFNNIKAGMYIKIKGSIRSSQHRDDNGIKRTRVYVQVNNIISWGTSSPSSQNDNDIVLEGKLYEKPLRRLSKDSAHELAEIILEVNKGYGKFSHIPIICWGTDAEFIESYDSGTTVRVHGRFQSRRILRHSIKDKDLLEEAILYEVSARSIEVVT